MLRPHRQADSLERGIERVLNEVKTWHGFGYRFTDLEFAHLEDLTTGEGSMMHGGRWNPQGLAALYYSTDLQTALLESLAQRSYYGLPVELDVPKMVFGAEIKLEYVLDLTNGRVRNRLRISSKRMVTTDWKKDQNSGTEALTQAIGRLAHSKNLQGVLVPSAANGAVNLVVFPDRDPDITILGAETIERAIKVVRKLGS